MKRLALIFTWIQLLLAVFIATPRELLHVLHECHETSDIHLDHSRHQVSTIHHHCELLQLDSPPVAIIIEQQKFDCTSIDIVFTAFFTAAIYSKDLNCFYLRGPPLTVS